MTSIWGIKRSLGRSWSICICIFSSINKNIYTLIIDILITYIYYVFMNIHPIGTLGRLVWGIGDAPQEEAKELKDESGVKSCWMG